MAEMLHIVSVPGLHVPSFLSLPVQKTRMQYSEQDRVLSAFLMLGNDIAGLPAIKTGMQKTEYPKNRSN